MYFDTGSGSPVWWNGSVWENVVVSQTGVPSNSYGDDGDFYFRSDGTFGGGSDCIYHKESGTWHAIA
jgi:hypothetical protein